MAFLAVTVHELGHLACLMLCGVRIRAIRLAVEGAEICCDHDLSYAGEMLAALSGPFAGALLAAGCLAVGEIAGYTFAYELAAVSILYTFFNLLPASPMDGGRALRAFMSLLFGPDIAARTGAVLDALCVLALFAGGIYVLILSRGNLTVLLCAVFLAAKLPARKHPALTSRA